VPFTFESPPNYPPRLKPTPGLITLASKKSPNRIGVETATVEFEEGDQERVAKPTGFGQDGKEKSVVLDDGHHMFAEIAIVEIFRAANWNARWVSPWGPKASTKNPRLYEGWNPDVSGYGQPPALSGTAGALEGTEAGDLLKTIAEARAEEDELYRRKPYSGCWDVIAWNNDDCLFFEAKRQGKDDINEHQESWLRTARKRGVPLTRFVVAEWHFV
jgi:hypothetical protein